MKKFFQVTGIICFFITGFILLNMMIGYMRIPDEMTINEYDEINVSKTYVCNSLTDSSRASLSMPETEYVTSIKLFNIFPIKSAKVTVTQRKYVVMGGDVFGIRLYTKGVMVIRIDEVTTSSGNQSPGKSAGLREGDMIISVDGVNVKRNKELSTIFAKSNGETMKIQIERNGTELTVDFTPVLSTDLSYKGGLWIRDSTAGIGTVTWYGS